MLRVGLIADMREEGWPSMDLVAEQLAAALAERADVTVELLRPPMRRVFSTPRSGAGVQLNADRLLNRHALYARWLRARHSEFDVFHIVDSSYAQLVHALPAERTIVSSHDLDTFRSILEPAAEPRPRWFKAMTQRSLSGLRAAARIVASSEATRAEIVRHGIADTNRTVVIPLAHANEFTSAPDPAGDAAAAALLGPVDAEAIDLLHVGSTIARKRIDVLIGCLAQIRKTYPNARLIRVGGPLTPEQRKLAASLNVSDAIVELPPIDRTTLAAIYRRAALVLLPSEREGFGLPLLEALACGTPVLAARIPALVELGGEAVSFANCGAVDEWVEATAALLRERAVDRAAWCARRERSLAHAARFSWQATADRSIGEYQRVAEQAARPTVMTLGKFYPPARGGMETHLQQLAQGVAGKYKVRILVSNESRSTTHELYASNIRVTRAARWAQISSAQLCPHIFRRLRHDDSEIVHVHWPNPPAIAAYLASGHKGRLIVTYHSDIVRQRIGGRLVEPLLDRALARADTIIVSSQAYLDSSRVLARHRERCVVIPFGVAVPEVPASDEMDQTQAIRARYGSRIVLAAGRLSSYKGFDVLIRAMRNVDAHLLLVGAGNLRDRLKAEIAHSGVADRVTMVGDVPSLAPYFGAADVFALPSTHRSEAFAIVQAEAMAHGIPVVNTSLATGVPFVSRHGETGLTVSPGDETAFAAALNQLLGDDRLRMEFGLAARERARTVFDLATMIDATCDVYARSLTSYAKG